MLGSFYAATIIELPFRQKDYFELMENFFKKKTMKAQRTFNMKPNYYSIKGSKLNP